MSSRKGWPRRVSASSSLEPLEPRILLASTVLADYAVTQDWGSGFEGRIQLTNQQATAVNDWTLEFDYSASIVSMWDGTVVSRVGNHYVITGAGWNNTLAA